MPAAAEENNEAAEIPTKCVITKINLNLKAQIQYLDFEGIPIDFLHVLSATVDCRLLGIVTVYSSIVTLLTSTQTKNKSVKALMIS